MMLATRQKKNDIRSHSAEKAECDGDEMLAVVAVVVKGAVTKCFPRVVVKVT